MTDEELAIKKQVESSNSAFNYNPEDQLIPLDKKVERFESKTKPTLLEAKNKANSMDTKISYEESASTQFQTADPETLAALKVEPKTFMRSLDHAANEVIAFKRSERIEWNHEEGHLQRKAVDADVLESEFFYNAKRQNTDAQYNKLDPEVDKIYREVGYEHAEDLDEAESFVELIQVSEQIKAAKNDLTYMNNNHDFVGTMGMYAAASIFDPLNALGYGIVYKAAKLPFMAARLSNAGIKTRAAGVGATAALIEGATEYEIQAHGERDYNQVAFTGMFAFGLAGGLKLSVDTLSKNFSVKQKSAYEKLEKDGFTLKASNPDNYRELLDIAMAEDMISPYRSKIAKFMGRILPDKLQHSPTFRAWDRGGSISALASLFDTLPGLSTKTSGEMALGSADAAIHTMPLRDGKTAMDVKYEMMEQTFHLDLARSQGFKAYNEGLRNSGQKTLSKEEFSELIWEKINKNNSKYMEAKLVEINKILDNKMNVEKITKTVDKSLEEDDIYKALSEEKQKKYREDKIDGEVNIAAREKMSNKDEFFQAAEDPVLGKIVDANNKYYGYMDARMKKAGIPNSRYFDSRFYLPRMYDRAAIEANKDGAIAAFEEAIVNSAQYKNELAIAIKNLSDKVKQANSKESTELASELAALDKAKVIAEKQYEDILKLVQDPNIPLSAKAQRINAKIQMVDNLEKGAYKDLNIHPDEYDQIAEVQKKEVTEKIREVINNSPSIKHLLKLTGVSPEQILLKRENALYPDGSSFDTPHSGVSTGRIALTKDLINESVIIHELLHTLTNEAIHLDTKFAKEMNTMREFIFSRKNELAMNMGYESFGKMPENVRTRVNYMLGRDELSVYDSRLDGELISVALEDPDIARALNKMNYGETAKLSIFSRLKNLLRDYLGIKKINSKSVLAHMFKHLDDNAKLSKVDAQEMKFRRRYNKTSAEIDSVQRQLDAGMDDIKLGRKLTDKLNRLTAKIQKDLDMIVKINEGKINSINKKHKYVSDNINKKIKSIESQTPPDIKGARDELNRIKMFPKRSAKQSVENITKATTIEAMVGLSDEVPRLKGRTLMIDPSVGNMKKYMQTDEAGIQQAYHYGISGRVATQHATGYTDVNDFRNHLIDSQSLSKEELKIATDLFELTKGTRQLPDVDNGWQAAKRQLTSFNYITMGGQFAKYGMSEIGAGIYGSGLGYLSELIPALRTTYDLYKGNKLTQLQHDLISMAEAGEIITNNSRSKYGDFDYIESTFAKGSERILAKGSRLTFKWSGLEGITTATRIALPRSFLRRIISQAKKGLGAYDLIRWGINPEDMANIAKQPITLDKDGRIIDFAFEKWDKKVKEKFQLAASRMARDTIMQADAIRVPAWMNDGSNVPYQLIKQFMTFATLANERLFLRGFSENRRMAVVGVLVSMGMIGAMEKAVEEISIATGLVDEDARRYDLSTEEGRAKLGRVVAFRHSFVGAPSFVAENIDNFTNNFNGAERVLGQGLGPTVGRALNIGKATGEYINEGKLGTSAQINVVNGLIPFKFPIIANYANGLAKEIRDESRAQLFYKDQ